MVKYVSNHEEPGAAMFMEDFGPSKINLYP